MIVALRHTMFEILLWSGCHPHQPIRRAEMDMGHSPIKRTVKVSRKHSRGWGLLWCYLSPCNWCECRFWTQSALRTIYLKWLPWELVYRMAALIICLFFLIWSLLGQPWLDVMPRGHRLWKSKRNQGLDSIKKVLKSMYMYSAILVDWKLQLVFLLYSDNDIVAFAMDI